MPNAIHYQGEDGQFDDLATDQNTGAAISLVPGAATGEVLNAELYVYVGDTLIGVYATTPVGNQGQLQLGVSGQPTNYWRALYSRTASAAWPAGQVNYELRVYYVDPLHVNGRREVYPFNGKGAVAYTRSRLS